MIQGLKFKIYTCIIICFNSDYVLLLLNFVIRVTKNLQLKIYDCVNYVMFCYLTYCLVT